MTQPRFSSVYLSDAIDVNRLLQMYTAGFHNYLAMGRALASHSPKVTALEDKWLIVSGVYALIDSATNWARRLGELGRFLPIDSSPSDAVARLANEICRTDPAEAIETTGAHIVQWTRFLAECELFGDALHYHDIRLLRHTVVSFSETIALIAERYPRVLDDHQPLDADLLGLGAAPTNPTGTPRLRTMIPATRAYPPESTLLTTPFTLPPDTSNAARYAASLHDQYQIEFIAIDIPLVNIADQPDLPLDFYADMARHAHDEMRHCWLLDRCLESFSIRLGDYPFVIPDRYELMVEQDLLYRLIILSRTGESEAIDLLNQIIPQLEAAGDMESVRMWQYVLVDEVRHTAFANKWLRHLVGDSDEAVADATRVAVERYNDAIRAGRLAKPLRRPDFISTPSELPVNALLYAQAGFSEGEIATMNRVRSK
jgi:uncharacterized ferritin-like protein (DUF455 family)